MDWIQAAFMSATILKPKRRKKEGNKEKNWNLLLQTSMLSDSWVCILAPTNRACSQGAPSSRYQASARLASKHGSKQGLDWLQSKQATKC